MIRYSAIRYFSYFSMRSKADINKLNLLHGTKNKKVGNGKNEKINTGYAQKHQ